MKYEVATVAAHWWALELLEMSPKNFDIGGTLPCELLASILFATEAMKNMPSIEQVECFEKKLEEKINSELENMENITLYVDYVADDLLTEALSSAGINANVLPIKTTMNITRNKVSVSKGYAEPSKVLFSI